ncbi:MAG: LysR family transcriptional regulator [Rhodobacteraceae bacterium]|jgi:DNA-binding transcriptional LysR family regulator|nr:LysR family transcriptional regulator [Paracoccaceae bacterium]
MLRKPLLYLDMAARYGSIRKAAERLNVASSAVNRQLLLLEEELGVPLFERLPRGIRPTTAGELVLSHVRRWGREERTLLHELGSLRSGVRGTIRIAAAESVCETILPEALVEMHRRFPLIDFRIVSGDNARLTADLLTKDSDIVIAFDLVEHEKADVLQTITSPLGIIAPRDHPLATREVVTFADYSAHPFVLPGEEWLRHSGLRKLLEGRHAPPRVVARAERPMILKSLVGAGVGVAFLTRLGARSTGGSAELAWVPLAPGIAPPALIALMVPRDRVTPLSSMVLTDILRECMQRAEAAGGG